VKRTAVLLGLALLAAGCGGGSKNRATSPPGPPPITLVSDAGRQPAVPGSSCVRVAGKSGTGTGVCRDAAYPAPRRASVVRPGELVRVDVPGAQSMEAEVHRLGCHRTALRRIDLGPSGGWKVDLAPGTYELLVSVGRFELDGAEGDTSGGLGLWVSAQHPLAVVSAKTLSAAGC
jgi:hypothetical protein